MFIYLYMWIWPIYIDGRYYEKIDLLKFLRLSINYISNNMEASQETDLCFVNIWENEAHLLATTLHSLTSLSLHWCDIGDIEA